MLSGFSSYFFGANTEEELQLPLSGDNAGVFLTTVSTENSDWVLVETDATVCGEDDADAEGAAGTYQLVTTAIDSSDSPPGSVDSTPAKSEGSLLSASVSGGSCDEPSDFECFRGPYLNTRDLLHDDEDRPLSVEAGVLSDVSSQPEQLVHPSMEECWLVTPPPCFLGATEPAAITTNPLEDLLIEHPSMSVYHPRRGELRMDSSLSSVDFSPVRSESLLLRADSTELLGAPSAPAAVTVTSLPTSLPPVLASAPHAALVNRAVNFVPAAVSATVRPSSWSGSCSRMRRENSRSFLERKNRLCQLAGRGHAIRRSQRLTVCHSGMNNSRRCQ